MWEIHRRLVACSGESIAACGGVGVVGHSSNIDALTMELDGSLSLPPLFLLHLLSHPSLFFHLLTHAETHDLLREKKTLSVATTLYKTRCTTYMANSPVAKKGCAMC